MSRLKSRINRFLAGVDITSRNEEKREIIQLNSTARVSSSLKKSKI
jgi:hypothetical protein